VSYEDVVLLAGYVVAFGAVYLVFRALKAAFAEAGAAEEQQRLSEPGPLGMTAFSGPPFHMMDPAWNAAPLKEWMGREFSTMFRGAVDGVELIAGRGRRQQMARVDLPEAFVIARIPASVPYFTIHYNRAGTTPRDSTFAASDLFGRHSTAVWGSDADAVRSFLEARRAVVEQALHSVADLAAGDGWMIVWEGTLDVEKLAPIALALAKAFSE
jgi:hypothetical protein